MKTLSELAQYYYDWQLKTNFNHDINENTKYFWSIPQQALDGWKTEIDEYKDSFTTHVYNIYQNMFQIGHNLLGLVIGHISNDNYIRLYELNENIVSWNMQNVLCSKTINVLVTNGIKQYVQINKNTSLKLPIVIKPNTLTIDPYNDDGEILFDLIDSKHNQIGVCTSSSYELKERNQHRLKEESWLATIDYCDGDLHLIRSNTTNEKKFVDYYSYLIRMLNSIITTTVKNDDGTTTTTSTISYYPEKSKITPYNYINISGTVTVLGEPLHEVFKFNIN